MSGLLDTLVFRQERGPSMAVSLKDNNSLIYRILHAIYGFLILLSVFYLLITNILKKSPRKSQVFIIHQGGFGNIPMQSDLFLRYITHQGYIALLFSPNRHNPTIQRIYGKQFFVINRASFSTKFQGESLSVELRAIALLKFVLSFGWAKRTIWQLHDLKQKAIPFGIDTQEPFQFWRQKLWYLSAKDYRTSDLNVQNYFSAEFQLLRGAFSGRVCSLYLRKKGSPEKLSNFWRSGKSLYEYDPMLTELKKLKFSTLVYGDVDDLELDFCTRFMEVFSYRDLGIEKEIWNIIAPIFAEFTIGNSGGGLQIPISFGRKILLIDAFGYWNWFPNTLHSFKSIFDSSGNLINPYKYLINDQEFGELESFEIRLSHPLLDIRILHEFLSLFPKWPKVDEFAAPIQKNSLVHHAPGAVISREWLKWNRIET